MITGEDQAAARIARQLDAGLADIDGATLARLRAARESALERLEAQPEWRPATANGNPLHRGTRPAYDLRRLASIVLLIGAICSLVYWQHLQHEEPIDIDAKLLSGDLPIDAYLDKGLDAWLTR